VGVKRAQIKVVVKMGSKTIVEEKKIEETIKNIPEDWFTVLDFTEVFRLAYSKSGRGWLKGSDSSEAREDTTWRRTSRIDLMYTRRNHTRFWLHLRDIKKESLGAAEEPQRKKGKFLEAHG